jgi:predicted nuclease with TOPRIM domain
MAIPSRRSVRGLSDIRTASSMNDQKANYKVYQKLSSLEMAKLRLENERESLVVRLFEVEERIRELVAEEAALVRRLTARGGEAPAAAPAAQAEEGEAAPDPREGGLKLRY